MNNQSVEKKAATALRHHATPFIEFIQQLHPLSRDIIDFVQQNTYLKKIGKGKFILKEGEVCNDYYFITKGVLRSFLKFGSKEITIWINPENEITTSIRSMTSKNPSQEYIQAVEDSELIVIPFEIMNQLYNNFPITNTIGRMLLEIYYGESEERVYICRIPSAELRYQHFIDSRPELLNRVPLKYIASYLGMTLETLSRLRAKRTSKK